MLVWDGWHAVFPRGCWKETGKVWILLALHWIFRGGTHNSVNVGLSLGSSLMSSCKSCGTSVLDSQALRMCVCGVPISLALSCKEITSVAVTRTSTINYFLSTWVLVPAHLGEMLRAGKSLMEQEEGDLLCKVSQVL